MSTVLQNVNLYLPEFRQKKYWLDAEKTVLLAGLGVVLLIIATGIEYWQLVQLRGELAEKEQEQQQIATETDQLIAQYGVQTEDPALLANIQELEADLQSKQALLQFLEGRELGNASGFSEHLADLSRYHLQGLSLTNVTLGDGGRSVELEGQVLRPELVTLYLQNLAKGGTYTGKNFERVNIDKDEVEVAEETDGTGPANGRAVVWNFHVRSQDSNKTTQRTDRSP